MIICEDLKKILRDHILDEDLKDITITDDTLLLDNLNFDSLTFIQLVVNLEQKYNIEINELNFDKINKFSDLYQCIQEAVNGSGFN